MSDSTSRYPTVEAFYDADEARRRSPELDYGVWWRAAGVVYRVTWVEATGELVAVQLTPAHVEAFTVPDAALGELDLFGFGVAVYGGEAGEVAVLGVVHGREVVERLLDGWAEVCGEEGSLAWVVERVRRAGLEAPA